jgi:hypothetical protein
MLQAVALRIVALLVILSGLALGAVASSAPVLARGTHSGDVTGYSMSLVASSADLQYGENIKLTATLSYPESNPPDTLPRNYHIVLDGYAPSEYGNLTETSPVVSFYTIYLSLPPGKHIATAVYVDPTTNAQVTSSPVTWTVEKINSNFSLSCQGPNFVATFETMQFTVYLTYSFSASDWTDATVTIKFVGPTTVVSAPQVIDNYVHTKFTVSPPTQAGTYQIQCIFSGNNVYTSGQVNLPLTVSAGYGVGGAQLYSNPTTLHLDTTKPFTLYLVLHAAKGLPVPTGQVYFNFGNAIYGPGTLNADGTLLATFKPTDPPGWSASNITVVYTGDTNYNYQPIIFSQTNPPIPGNVGSGGTSNLGSGATATPNPNATVTPTVTTVATATTYSATGASSSLTATVSAGEGPNWALLAGLIVAVLALIGCGVGVFLTLRTRRAPLASPAEPSGAQSPYGQYGQYWQSSQYPQRDVGWNNSGAPTYPDQSQAPAPTPRFRPPADDAQW